jgi:hypothetical protein
MQDTLFQQPTPLTSASTLFDAYRERVKEMKKVRQQNDRQELVNKICDDLKIEKKYARGIYFTLLTNKELTEEWEKARAWKVNPPALFNKRVRSRNKEIKERLK